MSHLQKNDIYKSQTVKNELLKWVGKTFNPSHFLTVQLPDNKKSANLEHAKNNLKNIMKAFEKSLMNNWERHHLPFIAFAEQGTSQEWHFHILFNQDRFTEEQLQNAVFMANIREKLPSYCLDLKPIADNLDKIEAYCSKEIKIRFHNKLDSDRIIFSDCLFGLKSKRTSSDKQNLTREQQNSLLTSKPEQKEETSLTGQNTSLTASNTLSQALPSKSVSFVFHLPDLVKKIVNFLHNNRFSKRFFRRYNQNCRNHALDTGRLP